MSTRGSRRARLALPAALVLAALLVLTPPGGSLLRALTGAASARAATAHTAAAGSTAADTLEPDLNLPASDVTVFGASPGEATGEAWAYGYVGDVPATVGGQQLSDQWVLLQRTAGDTWQIVPLPDAAGGGPLAPGDSGADPNPGRFGAFGGQATPAGGVVLLSGQNVVVRNPGGAPYLAAAPGAALASGESLTNPNVDNGSVAITVPYAAIDDTGGDTGVLIAPYDDSTASPGVLHWDGSTQQWTREPIAVPSGDSTDFTPLALQCGPATAGAESDSPDNCWLLARSGSGSGEQLLLFDRVASSDSSGYSWVSQPVSDWLLGSQSPPSGAGTPTLAPLAQGAQMLTVTSQGVWVDFSATVSGTQTDVSELVAPGTASGSGGPSPTLSNATVDGTWCYPTSSWCSQSLGEDLPSTYRSFAWPGTGSSDPGTRIITGLADGALLELDGAGSFSWTAGTGGTDTDGAAAFASPQQGWLNASSSGELDGEGSSPVAALSTDPQPDQLQSVSVPFEQPLLAVATQDGYTPGDSSSPALAVGLDGEVARYAPGQGWEPEALLNGSGVAQTPTLTGVAWPQAGRAYAVGDDCAMWLWQSTTDLWESDPAKPYNCTANFNAVAFDPSDPTDGYAVGEPVGGRSTLLAYGKTWTQVPLPTALQDVDFTSIAFAGSEALATYLQFTTNSSGLGVVTGGLAVDNGSGWEVDTGVAALLASLPSGTETVLSKVAGVPDGDGAVAAGPGIVIETNDATGDDWTFSAQPLPGSQNVSALAAYSDGSGQVEAVISIELDQNLNPSGGTGYAGVVPVPVGSGQPPAIESPDPLPDSGYVLEQTASGWVDMEHMAYPSAGATTNIIGDAPIRPDPVLALSVSPDGSEGLAVGGQTGNVNGTNPFAAAQTAGIMTWGSSTESSVQTGTAAIATDPSEASFVLAGDAACAELCAAEAGDGLGPDVDLQHALSEAGQVEGLRAFLYAGDREPSGSDSTVPTSAQLPRELDGLAALLGSGPSSLPVYAATSADLEPDGAGDGPFAAALGSLAPVGQHLSSTATVTSQAPPSGTAAYAFESTGADGGPVDVIVLDYSQGQLGSAQQTWLANQLQVAKSAGVPAIVMGADALGFTLPGGGGAGGGPAVIQAGDAATVSQILIQGGASAYLFDYPGANLQTTVDYEGKSIPAFGSGTLGYVGIATDPDQTDLLGSSAFLVVSVETADRDASTNVAPVTATAIPDIGSLALEATGGLLLRRSEVTLFDALARRPLGGSAWIYDAEGQSTFLGPSMYDPLPFDCVGANCAYQVPEQVTFTSSNPDIGNFVEPEPGSDEATEVYESPSTGEPVADSSSGLFCAYNAGTTTVTVAAGGLTYSLPVTVQAGSVQQPCGTVPLTNPPPVLATAPPAPGPASPTPASVASAPPAVPAAVHHAALPVPFNSPGATLVPVHVIVPPPAPGLARPATPLGSGQVRAQSQISQPTVAVQPDREEQAATQNVHHMVAVDDQGSGGHPPVWPIGLVLLIALAGSRIRLRPRYGARGRRRPGYARAYSNPTRRRR